MEEFQWQSSAEEYRTIQGLVRDTRYQEAIDRAERVLSTGQLGRKQTARLHSLICWIYAEQLRTNAPVAALHGEEAVRLALAVHDPWIRCDALARLVPAYCHMGQISRAEQAVAEIEAEVTNNPAVIAGGPSTVAQLRARIAAAAGDPAGCRAAVSQVELILSGVGLRTYHHELAAVWLAIDAGERERAAGMLKELTEQIRTYGDAASLAEAQAAQAVLSHGPAAHELAREAFYRVAALGRLDLARTLRRRIGHLL